MRKPKFFTKSAPAPYGKLYAHPAIHDRLARSGRNSSPELSGRVDFTHGLLHPGIEFPGDTGRGWTRDVGEAPPAADAPPVGQSSVRKLHHRTARRRQVVDGRGESANPVRHPR